MAVRYRLVHASPEKVFDLLANGWAYPSWVVGAARIRAVDESWPEPGSRLHHSVGLWPFLIDDVTTMEEWDPPRRAVVRARGQMLGQARAQFDVRPRGRDSVVRMEEIAIAGPGLLLPKVIRDVGNTPRLDEILRRLAYLIEKAIH